VEGLPLDTRAVSAHSHGLRGQIEMHYTQITEDLPHLLANLGWRLEPVSLGAGRQRELAALGFDVREIHTLQTDGGTLATLRLSAHQLPNRQNVLGAFVETTWEVLGLLRWCQATLGADAALLIDPSIAWLHRIEAGDHCLICPDGDAVEDRLLPVFAGEPDPVAAILNWQRESTEARGRGLRQWMRLWERRLGEACSLATADARRLICQLIFVRKCRHLRWVQRQPALARALERPLGLLFREEIEKSLAQALRAVDLLWRELGIGPCHRGPAERQRVEEGLSRSELAVGSLLRSIELLSVEHLAARTWLTAEAEPELQQISWRLCVAEPEPMAAHGAITPHQSPCRRLDVLEVGYGHILHVVEAAIRWVVAYNSSLAEEYALAGRSSFQPDFLTLADGGVELTGVISDPVHFTLHHLVEVTASLPAHSRLLRWLLTLRLLELADESDLTLERLPDLDSHL
jgi:hypothetical protein